MGDLFFGMGWLQIAIILIVAFIAIGPEKSTRYARQAGKFVRQFRKVTSGATQEITKALDLDREEENARPSVRQNLEEIERSLAKDAEDLKQSLRAEAASLEKTLTLEAGRVGESIAAACPAPGGGDETPGEHQRKPKQAVGSTSRKSRGVKSSPAQAGAPTESAEEVLPGD